MFPEFRLLKRKRIMLLVETPYWMVGVGSHPSNPTLHKIVVDLILWFVKHIRFFLPLSSVYSFID